MSQETTTSAEKAVQEERVVTLWSSRGKKDKISTTATTWGELKKQIPSGTFDLQKLHATENILKTDLVNDLAVLPTGPFVIFFRPKETKSGAFDRANASSMGYKDLKAAIKADKEAYGDHAGEHYGNYTQMTTKQLQDKYGSYTPPISSAIQEKPKKEKEAKNVADVVSAVADTKRIPITNADRIATVEQKLKDICVNTGNEAICERIESVLEEIEGVKAEISEDTQEKEPTEFVGDNAPSRDSAMEAAKAELKAEEEAARKAEEAAKAEAKRLEDEENAELEKMEKELSKGFKK